VGEGGRGWESEGEERRGREGGSGRARERERGREGEGGREGMSGRVRGSRTHKGGHKRRHKGRLDKSDGSKQTN
jgi:hypothetical protein